MTRRSFFEVVTGAIAALRLGARRRFTDNPWTTAHRFQVPQYGDRPLKDEHFKFTRIEPGLYQPGMKFAITDNGEGAQYVYTRLSDGRYGFKCIWEGSKTRARREQSLKVSIRSRLASPAPPLPIPD
jgi:hypothetical protein